VTSTFEPVIHRAVARRAAQRPSATAIIAAGQHINYATLDAAADDYAAELTELGVRPGSVVPLLLPRSAQLIALQLGILKCGAAYAGLDLRWPAERIGAILELLAAPLVVVAERDAHLAGTLSTYQPPREGLAEATSRRATRFEPHPSGAADPATLFFTSGTTGRPKVVVSPHQAVTRMFQPGGLAGFGPGHATPQAAPLPWDMYAFEVWGQLVSGGSTVLVEDDHLMPRTLRQLVRTDGVDTLWLTSSLFNLFVDEDIDCFAGLGHVLTGGEKLSPAHVRAFLSRHPRIPLRNGYGPAESAMLTTTRLLRPEDCDLPGGVPDGTAVSGTTVLVLDSDDRPCPPGQPGEICIAGQGLACGYFGAPELTAAKFPTVQVDSLPVRIYRTGDIGVTDEIGVLHFRGRADRQVKISGHRVELDEIEGAARRLPGVRDCVTIPVRAPHGEVTRVALFYVADPSLPAAGGDDPLDVRVQLQRQLPGYLVPGVVQRVDQFPFTANGKVDGAALLRLSRRARPAARTAGPAEAEP
jgi:amino acid adenylation domain-containing protein